MCSTSHCIGRVRKGLIMQAKVALKVVEVGVSEGLSENISDIIA